MAFVTCDEYCVRVSDSIKEYQKGVKSEAEDFPFERSALSDHLMVSAILPLKNGELTCRAKGGGPMCKFITWNVLNKKYLKHMQKTKENDNQRLGNHPIANMDPAAQASREWQVCESIQLDASDNGTILCLQEVSGSLLEMLIRTLAATHMIQTTRTSSDADCKITNCNAVIAPRDEYDLVNNTTLIPGEDDKSPSDYCTFRHSKTGVLFNVASVHLAWGSKADFRRLFLDIKTDHRTFIAGDFNRGVRYPIAPDGMHMRHYNDLRFMYPDPTLDGHIRHYSGHSHVCQLKNVGSTAAMLDRIDHIIVIDPAESAETN